MRPTLFFSALLSLFFSFLFTPARADHALQFNPSFYPHEIQVKTVDLISAKRLLSNNSLHAYIGGNPFPGGETPQNLAYVESLDSYLVATFNLASKPWKEREARCGAAGQLVSAMAANKGDYIFHPYPVTPYHEDYLQHFDLAESAKNRYRTESNQVSAASLKIRAKGSVAEKIVHSMSRNMEKGGDATVEEIGVENLVSPQRIQLNAWLGPPWLKEGWFHSYVLLSGTVADAETKRTVDSIYLRLVTGGYDNTVQRVNLERKLVSLLVRDCIRVVLGYTVKREYFNNSDYSEGVEDIARDSQTGFNSPIFIRTVKLKDFQWNGWLRLGIATKPSAAWNPIGGFSDTAGRFIWSAIGDPAVFSAPDKGNWIPNRVMSTLFINDGARSNVAIEIPTDALTPDPETAELRPVGTGTTAKAKIIYRVLSSSFHDKTSLTVADLLYNFSFAYRWSSRNPRNRNQYDPLVDTSTASVRELLSGFRIVRVDTDVKDFGDMKFTFKVPVIELFVTRMLADRQHVASVAPPWSSLPWHLMALMEETVKRGWAAFSADEAKRRGVSWLDIVRDQKIKDRMAGLVDRFMQQKYVPEVLKTFVSPAEAESRWSALKQFYKRRGHFLVTNGPYELVRWSRDTIMLQAFRDPTYPVGMGSFEQYTLPLRAYISKVEIRGSRMEITGEAENIFRFQRSYRIVREPIGRADNVQIQRPVLCRYMIVGPAGDVLDTGIADQGEVGKFAVDLRGKLPPGLHTVMVALYEGENMVDPKIKIMRHRVAAGS